MLNWSDETETTPLVIGWIFNLPTDPKRRFFLLGRFYGPEPALLDASFKLNNIEMVK